MTYLFRSLKPRDGSSNPFAELFRVGTFLFLQSIGDSLHFWNIPSHAPPGIGLESRVALAV